MKKHNEACNLCESCEHVCYRSLKDKDTNNEVKGFECPYADTHVYPVTECSNYSNPNAFQRFLRNKLAVTFTSLIIIISLIAVMFIFT